MRIIRQICSLAAVLLVSIALCGNARALEAFEITSYDITMDVRSDNSYYITETIDVSFSELRHGIIRSLPLKTYNGQNAAVSKVKVAGHKHSTSRASGYLDIKIGDPNKYASSAEQYVISYVYTIGEDGFSDMDELYWNLIGTEWDCYIHNVTFSIAMPTAFDIGGLNFTYGKYGSVQNENVSWSVQGNTIAGSLSGSLAPYEALTVALPLPQGYFADAQPIKGDNSLLVQYGWIGSGIAIAAGIAFWLGLGRKKRNFPTVEFYPPAGVTSADVGYLIDGRVDPYDITSLIIYWADRGYLTITEQIVKKGFREKKSYLLTRLSDPPPEAKEYERYMFKAMFQLGNGNQVDTEQLTNRFYTTVESVKKSVRSGYESSQETRIFEKSNTVCRWLLRFIGIIVPLPIINIIMANETESQGLALLGQSALLSLVFMISLFVLAHMIVNIKVSAKGQAFTAFVFSMILCAILIYGAYALGLIPFGILAAAGVFSLGILASLGKRRTKLGDWYQERLIGLKEFIKATEKDRIKLLVDENPQYFYNILPYAMVLGVTNKWAKNFDTITLAPPNWYNSQSTAYGAFSAARFAQDIESNIKTVSSSMHSRPASSGGSGGSSGGGSSGGGSGGGGGSSW